MQIRTSDSTDTDTSVLQNIRGKSRTVPEKCHVQRHLESLSKGKLLKNIYYKYIMLEDVA